MPSAQRHFVLLFHAEERIAIGWRRHPLRKNERKGPKVDAVAKSKERNNWQWQWQWQSI